MWIKSKKSEYENLIKDYSQLSIFDFINLPINMNVFFGYPHINTNIFIKS